MMSEENTYLSSGNATLLELAKKFFANHPALVFSILYFYFSVVGTVYTYILLDKCHDIVDKISATTSWTN